MTWVNEAVGIFGLMMLVVLQMQGEQPLSSAQSLFRSVLVSRHQILFQESDATKQTILNVSGIK